MKSSLEPAISGNPFEFRQREMPPAMLPYRNPDASAQVGDASEETQAAMSTSPGKSQGAPKSAAKPVSEAMKLQHIPSEPAVADSGTETAVEGLGQRFARWNFVNRS